MVSSHHRFASFTRFNLLRVGNTMEKTAEQRRPWVLKQSFGLLLITLNYDDGNLFSLFVITTI